MRATPVVLALCAVSSAQQYAFMDNVQQWFNQVAGVVINTVPNPINAAASAVAAGQVTRLTKSNWKTTLLSRGGSAATSSPGSGVDEWLVYVTGGNKTCLGRCAHADTAWNRSVPILSATKGSPNLAMLDCEVDAPLCYGWTADPPCLLHFRVPQPAADQTRAPSEVRTLRFNATDVTPNQIAKKALPEEWKKVEPYEGFFHPLNGIAAEYGLNTIVGWIIWGFNIFPSWLVMVAISMVSRSIMSRRMNGPNADAGRPGAGAPAAGPRAS